MKVAVLSPFLIIQNRKSNKKNNSQIIEVRRYDGILSNQSGTILKAGQCHLRTLLCVSWLFYFVSFYSVFLYLYRNHSLYLLSTRSFSISIATTRSIFFLFGLSLSLSQPLALSPFYSVFLYLYRNPSLYRLSTRSFSISIATTRSISFLFGLSLSLSQTLALSLHLFLLLLFAPVVQR